MKMCRAIDFLPNKQLAKKALAITTSPICKYRRCPGGSELAKMPSAMSRGFRVCAKAGAGEGRAGLRQAADGIHTSANAGADRAGQGPERDRHQGGDGQPENPDKRRPLVLIAGDSPRSQFGLYRHCQVGFARLLLNVNRLRRHRQRCTPPLQRRQPRQLFNSCAHSPRLLKRRHSIV